MGEKTRRSEDEQHACIGGRGVGIAAASDPPIPREHDSGHDERQDDHGRQAVCDPSPKGEREVLAPREAHHVDVGGVGRHHERHRGERREAVGAGLADGRADERVREVVQE